MGLVYGYGIHDGGPFCYYRYMNSASERRLAENEVLFREFNEGVQRQLEDLRAMAKAHGEESLLGEEDIPLYFYCECSKKDCEKRIKIKPSRYDEIHKNRKHFTILCGHEAEEIERVIAKETNFCVIEKYRQPPRVASKHHPA